MKHQDCRSGWMYVLFADPAIADTWHDAPPTAELSVYVPYWRRATNCRAGQGRCQGEVAIGTPFQSTVAGRPALYLQLRTSTICETSGQEPFTLVARRESLGLVPLQ